MTHRWPFTMCKAEWEDTVLIKVEMVIMKFTVDEFCIIRSMISVIIEFYLIQCIYYLGYYHLLSLLSF